jgi:hypothetical protein
MKTFTVTHTNDVDCETPHEAASMFLDFLRDTRTDEDGNAFTVTCGSQSWDVVLYADGSAEVKTNRKEGDA